jgi:filamentous hemagglutinin family protein
VPKPLAILLAALTALLPVPIFAAPAGEQVIEGEATFSRDGNTTVIDTATHETIVEYQSFDILQDEIVRIDQPTDDSRILNHVPRGDPTRVAGQLLSNGFVYIINPAGVFFGDTAILDVGGLVAGAGHIDYADFMAGVDRLTDMTGDVEVAEGARILAARGAALLGRRVASYGTIVTGSGFVAMVAGGEAALGSLDGHLIVRVDGGGEPQAGDADFALTQGGTIDAGAGQVVLSAGDTTSLAMNHTGITRGRDIQLEANGSGLVQVAGELDASAAGAGETGGRIQVTGDRVAILDARLDASGDAGGGEILVGGDAHGAGDVPTARRTYVSADAELVADAMRAGDGGKIVVWADQATGFYGAASARGGEQEGDGGFVEISGRRYLEARGHRVDLGAANGGSGTLLYDPQRIRIRGGSADGSDGDDPGDPNTLDDGTAGRILAGDPPDDGTFEIFESEIEGTNADIVLQASEHVGVEGSFDHVADGEAAGVVIVMPGNSLVIQTTGAANDTDSHAIDLGDLTWRVSEGGRIFIGTHTGDASDPAAAGADIRVGRLEAIGRAYQTDDETGLSQPLLYEDDDLDSLGIDFETDAAVQVETQVGDIAIGSILVEGDDAANGGARFASAAGSVDVFALSGDVTVGSVEAVGGSATPAGSDPASPANGGAGGTVGIATGHGSVTVTGDIDVMGGDGLAGLIPVGGQDDPAGFAGTGGTGGRIILEAQSITDETPEDAQVIVQGDLIASGGTGNGVAAFGGGTLVGFGGAAGSIRVSGEGGVEIVDVDAGATPLFIVASGGNGTGGGGSAFVSGADTIRIESTSTSGALDPGDVVLDHVQIASSGGNAGGPGVVEGPGGPGGSGGSVLLSGGFGAVQAGGATIQSNGGSGVAGPEGGELRSGAGGSAAVVTIGANAGVAIGDITAVGGTGVNGAGGRGGDVSVNSLTADVAVAAIDVSGGGVDPDGIHLGGFHPDLDGIAIPGGDGGAVTLTTGNTDTDPPEPGGDVVLGGPIVGLGGVGVDEDHETPVVASGASVRIATNEGAIENAPGVEAPIRAGILLLTSPEIGSALDPIDLAGTGAETDRATLTVSGTLHANLLGSEAAIEDVTVAHTRPSASSVLTVDATPALEVVAEVEGEGGAPQTIETMRTAPDSGTALQFVLDEPDDEDVIAQNDLRVLEGAVALGAAGGSITNADGRLFGAASGSLPHIETLGNLRLEAHGDELEGVAAIGEDGSPLRVDGDTAASLELDALGDIHVDVLNLGAGGAFGSIEVVQESTAGETTIVGRAGDGGSSEDERIGVTDVTADPLRPVQRLTGSTAKSNSSFAYQLTAAAPGGGEAPSLAVEGLALGSHGLLVAPGDIELVPGTDPSIAIRGGRTLALDAGGDVTGDVPGDGEGDAAGPLVIGDLGGGSGPTRLLVDAGGSVGSAGDPLRLQGFTGGVELAAQFGGDFHLSGEEGGDLVITRVDVPDPGDASGDTALRTLAGVGGLQGSGDVSLANQGTIVLGAISVATPAGRPGHVIAGGDVSIDSSAVEIANAQYVEVDTDGDPDTRELLAVNPGSIEAGGDIAFAGAIDTSDDNTAVDDEVLVADDDDVRAALTLDADGVVSFGGDVGMGLALARLDTTRAVLPEGETREFRAGEAIFRGGLDGPAAANIEGDALALEGGAERTAVAFGGDVGVGRAPGGLRVRAQDIDFTVQDGSRASANAVVTGGEGIDLDTGLTETPQVATITDTSGNLRFQTSGAFVLGEHDKLSATGVLSIAAAQVTVGDLSASTISVQSPDIRIRTRLPAAVERPDGSTVMDGGVDWTADSIGASSTPAPIGTDPIAFYLGDGSVSIPGNLSAFQVRRLNEDLDGVDPDAFFGQDGAVLDLTGEGPPVIADPSRQMQREARLDLPPGELRFGSDAPAAGPTLAARQVLAFLRCSGVYSGAGAEGGCTSSDQAALAAVERFQDSALATDRAREITARYHEMVGTPAAVARLRAAFAAAGSAFAATREWSDGTLDGAELYRFLASDPALEPALQSLRELAWLFAELELLGLAGEDTRALQQTLAREFADAAGMHGLGADAVQAAVHASPIGLPE